MLDGRIQAGRRNIGRRGPVANARAAAPAAAILTISRMAAKPLPRRGIRRRREGKDAAPMLPRRATLAAAPALFAAPRARAAPPPDGAPLVVVEMFTSQSCSSCPPADALLDDLARDHAARGLLPLSFHVTYWDRLGWRDRFSLPEATERQRRYAAWLRSDGLYTPQAVVQGASHHVGSDRRAVLAAVERARLRAAAGPALALAPDGAGGLVLVAGEGTGTGMLWLVGFDARHTTPVRGGENAGRTLVQAHVVRALFAAGAWQGAPLRIGLARPAAGERAAALLQGPDGAILAAAVAPAG
jgi:hypothetical protein